MHFKCTWHFKRTWCSSIPATLSVPDTYTCNNAHVTAVDIYCTVCTVVRPVCRRSTMVLAIIDQRYRQQWSRSFRFSVASQSLDSEVEPYHIWQSFTMWDIQLFGLTNGGGGRRRAASVRGELEQSSSVCRLRRSPAPPPTANVEKRYFSHLFTWRSVAIMRITGNFGL
jgi:hypothetical protein